MSHVLKRVLDPIVELDEQRFGAMKALDLPLLVLTRTRDDGLSFNVMSSLARQELSGHFFVGVITDSPFAGTTPPFVTVGIVTCSTSPSEAKRRGLKLLLPRIASNNQLSSYQPAKTV